MRLRDNNCIFLICSCFLHRPLELCCAQTCRKYCLSVHSVTDRSFVMCFCRKVAVIHCSYFCSAEEQLAEAVNHLYSCYSNTYKYSEKLVKEDNFCVWRRQREDTGSFEWLCWWERSMPQPGRIEMCYLTICCKRWCVFVTNLKNRAFPRLTAKTPDPPSILQMSTKNKSPLCGWVGQEFSPVVSQV